MKAVWPDTVVEESNLTQTVFAWRKALGDSENDPLIITIPRQGYRFAEKFNAALEVAPPRWNPLWIGAAVVVAGGIFLFRRPEPAAIGITQPVKFEIPVDAKSTFPRLSPDGNYIALFPSFQTDSESTARLPRYCSLQPAEPSTSKTRMIDGNFVAYAFDQTGRPEVFVREFLPPDKLGERWAALSRG